MASAPRRRMAGAADRCSMAARIGTLAGALLAVAGLLALLGLLGCPLAARAEADRPELYAATAPLAIEPGAQGLVRVPLSLALLRELRSTARNDIRVFNAAGEVVPHAWAGVPVTATSPPPTVALPHFRWPDAEAGATDADGEVRVEIAEGGRVVSVERRGATARQRAGASAQWLLDLTPLATSLRPAALLLHWGKASPDDATVAAVRVEASADARRWRTIGEATVLALRDAASGQAVAQRRVALTPPDADERYLRLHLAPPLLLERVEAEPAPAATSRPLASERFALQRAGPRTWTLDTEALLPVARMQVHVGQDNAVLPLVVSHRLPSDPTRRPAREVEVWSSPLAHTAYRLRRDGQVGVSPAFDLGSAAARQWRFVLDERVAAPDRGLEVTLEWDAPQLVVAARGPAPFRLALGRESAPPAAIDRRVLIPGYRDGDEFALPVVVPGALVVQPQAAPTLLEQLAQAGPQAHRRWLLWGVLGLAVVVLAVLAWRLGRDLHRPPGGRP